MKEIYGEELDKELSRVFSDVDILHQKVHKIERHVKEDGVLEANFEISDLVKDCMEAGENIRTTLLNFKKDGRSCKASVYNQVLMSFVDAVQSFENVLEAYEYRLKTAFENSEQTMSVKQIGDAHYLFRENVLERYGFGNPIQRRRKLESVHMNVSQLKAILVGLEFLVYAPDNCKP